MYSTASFETILLFEFCIVSKISICFSLIKSFPKDYKSILAIYSVDTASSGSYKNCSIMNKDTVKNKMQKQYFLHTLKLYLNIWLQKLSWINPYFHYDLMVRLKDQPFRLRNCHFCKQFQFKDITYQSVVKKWTMNLS